MFCADGPSLQAASANAAQSEKIVVLNVPVIVVRVGAEVGRDATRNVLTQISGGQNAQRTRRTRQAA
jgi:hypothetical protein